MNVNTPIFDPMLYYWISRLDAINILLFLCTVVLGGVTVLVWATYFDEGCTSCKIPITLTILFVLLAILAILCPSTDTALKMWALKYATPENIENVKDFTIEFAKEIKEALG